ncbi:thymidylate synthase [Bacillus phage Staley]|uniref:thymidylate synthase n=1 Tax=Bacillus phage Staley TaxID=1406792 RepID=U5PXL3_9CAUD|nr:thymidylate synthase [Bacillus phage Staley]AGY48750.1 thymidylate synthase [Bacillus phage Staley]
MSTYDEQIVRITNRIFTEGKSNEGKPIRARWDSDGSPAYARSVLNERMVFNGECPFPTLRQLGYKTPIWEFLWMWQKKSNRLDDLRELTGKQKTIWCEWEQEDGTIGKSYGWQLANKKRPVYAGQIDTTQLDKGLYPGKVIDGKPHLMLDQVDHLIQSLIFNRYSNQIKTTLWCVEDIPGMALPPCMYETHWQTWEEKLHLTVNIRSNDMPIGNPFNTFQMYVLQRMIAQVVGMEVGTLVFNIDNAHIYNRHEEQMKEMIQREQFKTPTLWVNPEVKNFYDFTISDFKLLDYESGDPIKFEDIAV